MKRVLSLGAGTQSSVLLLLADRGEVEPFDVAVFSDTGWEPREVYEHLEWLKSEVKNIPIKLVSQGNIREDLLISQVMGKKTKDSRWASMPMFVKHSEQSLTAMIDTLRAEGKPTDKTERKLADFKAGNLNRGMIRRQCTYEYKIRPIERFIKVDVLGLRSGQRWPKEPAVEQIFGISTDEWQRQRKPHRPCFVNVYPLIDMRWTRSRTIEWAEEHYPHRVFPRSACVGCPFRSDAEWRALTAEEFADACEIDDAVRHADTMNGEVYLHSSCIPLREVDLRSSDEHNGQLSLFQNECHGMCGV